jgi:hypothetical protein
VLAGLKAARLEPAKILRKLELRRLDKLWLQLWSLAINLDAVRLRLALYEELTNRCPRPFEWNFTREKLMKWLQRASPHFAASAAA